VGLSEVSVALLGVTHPHTSGRLKALLRRPGVRIVGAADDAPVADAFRDHFGLPRLTVDGVIGDPSIDAVLVHSASSNMSRLAVAALESGKSVLVEKPGGQTVADLQRLADAAQGASGVCQVGYSTRGARAAARAREIMESGILGRILQVRVHSGCCEGEAGTEFLNAPGEMGGAFWIIGAHAVDTTISLFSMPHSVNARMYNSGGEISPRCAEDAVVATLNYDDKIISLDFSSWEPTPWVEGQEIEVHGTAGVLRVGLLPSVVRVFLREAAGGYAAGWTEWRETSFPVRWTATPTAYSPELAEVANEQFFDAEITGFLGAMAGDNGVLCSAQEALRTARLVSACYDSAARSGAEILLP
jgi:predicted dehydrogenase